MFHSVLPGLEKHPKLHVAEASFQEGKAEKSPLIVCGRIPWFDALTRVILSEANADAIEAMKKFL